MTKQKYSWVEFDNDIEEAAVCLSHASPPLQGIYGIPKGGLVVAVALCNRLNVPLITNYEKVKNNHRILIVDDISDTGKTLSKLPFAKKHPTYAVFNRTGTKFTTNFMSRYVMGERWVVFPWEGNKENKRDGTKIF